MISYFFYHLCENAKNLTVFIKFFEWLIGNADRLPQLTPDQILKLKQLTVLTLAETYKVLPINS